jgi:hypothetical protein
MAVLDESTQDLVIRVRGALSESDALNNPEVRHRLEQVMADTTEMISKVICEGTGIADVHARYLSAALIGPRTSADLTYTRRVTTAMPMSCSQTFQSWLRARECHDCQAICGCPGRADLP